MDNDSHYFALSEENLEDVILSEKRDQWKAMRSRECTDNLTANATDNFFLKMCCNAHQKREKGAPGLFNKIIDVQKRCVYAVKRFIAMIERVISTSSAANV